ncbi:MAG: hypothetical protein PHY43_04565 [Verrucomicrobiales bacterium]|nr:hypothetical protein [Verrucomicrobiales bacterium]
MNDNCYLTWIIAGIGLVALVGVLAAILIKNKGMGTYNLRAVGIVLVLTFTALIATKYQDATLTAAIGIFGGIAGYLFGEKDPKISLGDSEKKLSELENRISKLERENHLPPP